MSKAQTTGVVVVVATATDSVVSMRIQQSLRSLGVAVTADLPQGPGDILAVVAVISEDSLRDARWLSDVEMLRGHRLVPVSATGTEHYDAAPAYLKEINGITWNPTEPQMFAGQLFRAVNSDLGRYRRQRSLESEALAWRASGFSEDSLIRDWRRAREAAAVSGSGSAQLRPETAALIADYASQSLAHAKSLRRKSRWRTVKTIAAMTLFVALPASFLAHKARAVHDDEVLLSGALLGLNDRADLAAIKSAAVLQTFANDTLASSAQTIVATEMNKRWGTGVITWEGDAALNDVVFTVDPGRTFTVDGGGAVAVWDVPRAKVLERRAISPRPLFLASGTEDGRHLVVTDQDTAYVVSTATWQSTAVPLASQPAMVQISADGSVAAIVDEQDQMVLVDIRATPSLRTIATYDSVLALSSQGVSGLVALVREGPDLVLVDLRTGQALHRERFAAASFEVGALGPDGVGIAVTGADNQIWFANDGLNLEPTGQAVPDLVTAIAVTERGWIVYGSDQFGVQAFATREGLPLGSLCRGMGRIQSIRVLGDIGACGMLWQTFDLDELGLTSAPVPDDLERTSTADTVKSGSGALQGALIEPETGDVLWGVADELVEEPTVGRLKLDGPSLPSGTRATVVTIAPNGATLAIGTDAAVVLEFDLTRGPGPGAFGLKEVSRTHLPDGAAITAVGYPARVGTLLVGSGQGLWYQLPSCAGCTGNAQSLQWIRGRRWNMYPQELIDLLPDAMTRELDLQPFPSMPSLEGA